jgi:hypothetical protein
LQTSQDESKFDKIYSIAEILGILDETHMGKNW